MQSRKRKYCVKKKKKNGALKNETKKNSLDVTKQNTPVNRTGTAKAISVPSSISSGKSPITFNFDKNRIKRIMSPFNKFQTNRNSMKASPDGTAIHSAYFSPGLTSKEKSFIICSCQTKSTRYLYLKDLAAEAIKKHKIFTIHTNGQALRTALVDRGWVEKLPANRMNLTKIRQGKFSSKSSIHSELERLLLSNLVEKHLPSFIWVLKEDQIDPKEMNENTIINKLKIDGLWTTKQGLCTSMRDSWFYIEDVAEVLGPRTYASDETGEIDEFVSDFKVTACTSLLKWVLSMVANDRPVFLDCGKVALNVIVFALNRCKEFLFKKQNKDIDKKNTSTVTPGQWNAFLKKYYRIIAKEDVFETDRENKLPLYMGYAKLLLKEIYKIRPQLSCEGCHNIWIIKPSHNCRGRGIRMASKLGVITDLLHKANSKFVIQKYIEEPLLIHDTKFDIRQYYLITSTYPLVIWMYKDCYLKFSSQKYNLKNYHESIHLTNNAVQKKYNNCPGRHPDLPRENMWDSDTYKNYLTNIGKEKVWDNIIYPGMKKSIVAILLACQDQLAVSKNRFELYGCDFILDKEFRPWLIEINSCPDLNPTTSVTARICPEVLVDIVKVVIDRANYNKAPIGKFECIYRQPMTMPRYGCTMDLCIRGRALPNEYFYRGKLHLKGSYEDCKGIKDRDINAMMNKIKHIYDKDIMVEPDEYNVKTQKKCGFYTDIGKTKSDEELGLGSEQLVITEQLDELVDEVNSVSHGSTNKSCEDFIEFCLKSVRSFAEPPEGVLNHNFSKLDDASSVETSPKNSQSADLNVESFDIRSSEFKPDTGPGGSHDERSNGELFYIRSSYVETHKALSVTDIQHNFTEEDRYVKESVTSSLPKATQQLKKDALFTDSALDSIREATVKLFDFLDKKEIEYRNSRK